MMRVRWNGRRADLERRMMGRCPGRVEDGPKSAPHNAESGANFLCLMKHLGRGFRDVADHLTYVVDGRGPLAISLETVWRVPC